MEISLRFGETRGELSARADVELAVDPREVRLDRLHAQVELRRYFLVRTAGRDELGDPPFRVSERVRRGRSAADPGKLCTRPGRPSGAPSCSKSSCALSSEARARRLCLARRRSAPSTSKVRPSSSGSASRACSWSARSTATRAAVGSPRALARTARQRPAVASAQARPSVSPAVRAASGVARPGRAGRSLSELRSRRPRDGKSRGRRSLRPCCARSPR